MRVVDANFRTITEYDLTRGELLEVTTLREDAVPVDNVTKFAPADEDWEQAWMYVPYPEGEPEADGGDDAVWEELDRAYREGVDSV